MNTWCKALAFAVLTAGFIFCTVDTSTAQQTGKGGTGPSPIFEFHSGFWVNLHHFLYWQAVASSPRQGSRRTALTEVDAAELSRLSPEEKPIWDSAIAYYRDSLIGRDLLFDRGMEATKNELEDSETSPDLAGVNVPSEVKATLLRAAPIYRKHWWPQHDEQNKHWMAELTSLIQMHGNFMRDSLVKIYDEPWPGEPVRVDAVAYANWAGAYTTIEPARPTISTSDPANRGTAALEIVFHETSHGMMDAVMNSINNAERAVNAQRKDDAIHFRRDLWHEVLFYTSGELVAERIHGYVPYADKNGLWARAWSGPDRVLIAKDWKPRMDGRVSVRQALTQVVNDLAASFSR
jgi:hypothetical protein